MAACFQQMEGRALTSEDGAAGVENGAAGGRPAAFPMALGVSLLALSAAAPLAAAEPFAMRVSDLLAADIVYDGDSSAGDAALETGPGEAVIFRDRATASSASIVNNGGETRFEDETTAQAASLTANEAGQIRFTGASTAADACIVVNDGGFLEFTDDAGAGGAVVTSNAFTRFAGRSRAEGAQITVNEGGRLEFAEEAGAGTAQIANNGTAVLTGNASLDGALVTNNLGATLAFGGESSAGTTSFIGNSGAVLFSERSTLGGGAITSNETGSVRFQDQASAGDGFLSTSGALAFAGQSSAADARIVGNAGATIDFLDDASAGRALISGGAGLRFSGRSSAGQAGITMAPGTTIAFLDEADGGQARLHLDAGASLDIAAAQGDVGLGRLGGAGEVLLGANTLLVGDDEPLVDFAGTIGDGGLGGGLAKTGSGTLNLSGQTDYGGATRVLAGTLEAGAEGVFSPRSAFVVEAGAALDLANLSQEIGSLAGAGSVDLADARLTLGGNGRSTVYAGIIEGTGGLVKTGAGEMTLSGVNSYSGPTEIVFGRLRVDGSIAASAVTVGAGGVLLGGGTVGATRVEGVLLAEPGAALGVAGDLTLTASGTLAVGLSPGGAGLIEVAGTAFLDGTLFIAPQGSVVEGDYRFLTAADVSGAFAALRSDWAFFDADILYGAADLLLRVERNALDFPAVAETVNQRATAAAIAGLGAGNPVFEEILQQSVPGARTAFDAFSGEAHAEALGVVAALPQSARQAMLARLEDPLAGVGLWGDARHLSARRTGDGNAAGFSQGTAILIGGVDALPHPDLRVGLAGHYARTRLSVAERGSSADIESFGLGVYGSWRHENWRLRGGADVAAHGVDMVRQVAVGTLLGTGYSAYPGWTAGAFGRIGYQVQAGGVEIEPFVGFSYLHGHVEGFAESGLGAANLFSSGSSFSRTEAEIGVRIGAVHLLDNGVTVRPSLALGYRRRIDGGAPAATHRFEGGAPYSVHGVDPGAETATVEARVDIGIDRDVDAGFFYRGSWSGRGPEHLVGLALRVAF